MTVEMELWRVDQNPKKLNAAMLNAESRLEQWINADISIASPGLMVIGKQVYTGFGRIDILAVDFDGNVVVLELKRDRSPRDVVAQILDYASWVHEFMPQDVFTQYANYLQSNNNATQLCNTESEKQTLFESAFKEYFKAETLPDIFSQEESLKYRLIIVATELDPSSERIVKYLHRIHNLAINIVYFKFYNDEDREFLSRCWLEDPTTAGKSEERQTSNLWNNEYYVSFAVNRDWNAAIKYGYIAAGSGVWYTRTLDLLQPGDRIWVNAPRYGYVGVAIVEGTKTKVTEFRIKDENGQPGPLLLDQPDCPPALHEDKDDDEFASYLVSVQWIKTVPLNQAVGVTGLFGNQNTVCRPKTPKWNHTVNRLKEAWEIS